MPIVPVAEADVKGELHIPEHADGRALVLTHGAGGNCRAPLLLHVAAACAARGLNVLRCDLPFRQRRVSGPPSPAGAAGDREGLRHAVQYLRRQVQGPLFLGGHSYGGRQASMLAAEEAEIATALLLFSYPLHPPGKPERLRTAHFPAIRLPAVFVHGTADPFGSIAELQAALSLIPTEPRLIPLEGAGHDLRRGRFDLASVLAALLDRG
jgi:uncharacterized protein